MKLYLAGLFTNGFGVDEKNAGRLTEAEDYHRKQVPWYLESYHYIHRQKYVDEIRQMDQTVFLDSGAFSAFTMGVDVDIAAYCDYIHQNSDIIDVASVLDGIGDPLKTWQNQQEMERLGVTPLPCFHYAEPVEYLQHYIENYEYITLGGMVPISTPQLKFWLDDIWEKYLTDEQGNAKIKVHGFGLTTISLMERYPWYSVDSSSWVQIPSNGNILLPGTWRTIGISDKSPSRKVEGQHFRNITTKEQEYVRHVIESAGFEVERLETEYLSRWAFCCYAFNELGRVTNEGKQDQFEDHQMRFF